MLRKLLLCLLVLAAVDTTHAQTVGRSGTWSARSSTGLTLGGTWTAVPDSTGGAVTGTWTLVDAQGGTAATGAWSAAWTPALRSGAWRSVVTGRAGEFAGTFTADAALKREAPLADLFERAVQAAVGGAWRTRGVSGAWSIRAAPREGGS